MLLTADRNPDKLELALSVQSGPLEHVGKPARLEVLEEVAQVTNGRLLSPGEVSTIIKEIYDMPEQDPLERRLQIWAHPLWGGFIVLLLGIFWTGRKMTGTI